MKQKQITKNNKNKKKKTNCKSGFKAKPNCKMASESRKQDQRAEGRKNVTLGRQGQSVARYEATLVERDSVMELVKNVSSMSKV